jgi:hypothetical protein
MLQMHVLVLCGRDDALRVLSQSHSDEAELGVLQSVRVFRFMAEQQSVYQVDACPLAVAPFK